jgi:hypothetical protein
MGGAVADETADVRWFVQALSAKATEATATMKQARNLTPKRASLRAEIDLFC